MQRKTDVFSECHPMLQFLYFVLVIFTTMFISHPVILLFSFVGAVCYSIILKGAGNVLRRQLLAFFPVFLLVALINPAFNHYGVTVLFYLKTGPVTWEALAYGIVLSGILWTALVWFSDFNHVMTTDKFVWLFGRLAPALSLVLSMVFRLIPRYKKRLQVIRNAQKCMGKDKHSRSVFARLQSEVEELSMLATWALENGMDTSASMLSRGYGTAKRTSYSIFSFQKRDRACLFLMVGLYSICLIGFFMGNASVQYNPQISIQGIPVSRQSLLTYGAWMLFVLFPVELEIHGKIFYTAGNLC